MELLLEELNGAKGSLVVAAGAGVEWWMLGPCAGRGGAGLGGGCLLFFGGNAGLGLSGRGGAAEGCVDKVAAVGAWRIANGSQPKASLSVCWKTEAQVQLEFFSIFPHVINFPSP